MKKRNFFKIMLLALSILLMTTFSSAVADDDDHRRGHDEDETWLEEVGEILGWGTVFAASAAGILLPARRMVQPVNKHYPTGQTFLISLMKGLKKYHVRLGVLAVGVSMIHGLSLYLAEEELVLGDWMGVVSASLLLMAGVIGGILARNKNKMKSWKKPHLHFLLAACFFAVIHILMS